MTDIVECNEKDYSILADIWERSVRASHSFLDDNYFNEIKAALIPVYFPAVDIFAAEENDRITGFIGVAGERIEMLFVDSVFLGKGYGTMLIEFAKRRGASFVDVNEQNHAALNFYIAKGFRVIGRDDIDSTGRPYPILHLSI